MLSINFAEKANIITVNSPLTPIIAQNETTNVRLKIYQGDTFEIELPKAELINVFAIAELIESGERVTSFVLESIDENEKSEILYEGTSIGFYRAVKIKSGMYKRFRLSITGSLAQPMLLNFGLHYFEDHNEDGKSEESYIEIKSCETADNSKTVVVGFDGIYPYNYIEFQTSANTAYMAYAFNGLSYDLIAEGYSSDEIVKIQLQNIIEGSYQLKIVANNALNGIKISKK